MASIYEQAQAFRAALIKRDTAAIEYLTNQYSAIYKRLVRDLEAVTSQIAAAQASGEKVSRAWLNRQFRYQEFLRQLDREFQQYGSTVASLVQARQFFEAQQGANDAATITGSFARLNIGAIENVVANLRESSPLGRLLAGFGDDAAAHVGSVLRDAIVKGENPRKIAGQVRDALNIPLWRALRIARTEATRAYRQSTMDAYAANERVTGWYWLASKSRRTCLACLALDGQFFPKDKPQKAHIACRCTAVPGIQDQPAPKRETAGQWFAKQPDSIKREMMSGAAFEAYREGKVDLRDFVGLAKSSKWGDQYHELSLRRALAGESKFPTIAIAQKGKAVSLEKAIDTSKKGAFPDRPFYHQTKDENIMSIEESGLRASDGIFGSGVYLTEKADDNVNRGFVDSVIKAYVTVKNPVEVKGFGELSRLMDRLGAGVDDEPASFLPSKGIDAIRIIHADDRAPWLMVFDPKNVLIVKDSAIKL